MELPAIRYARNGEVSLAYQVWGVGARSMFAIPPMAQNIELVWEDAGTHYMLERFGGFSRMLHFDKRGTGLSDRATAVPTLDERVEDARAIMDDAGIERCVLLGTSEGGPMAVLFAVTYPERVDALVLLTTAASFVPDDETSAQQAARLEAQEDFVQQWGTTECSWLERFAPSIADDAAYRVWQARYGRQSASPAALRELVAMIDAIDVRPLLGEITVPTLVVHRTGDRVIPVEEARRMAAAIPGATFVEVPGIDHFASVGDVDSWMDPIERFVTGTVEHRSDVRRPRSRPTIRTMGGFAVAVDGLDVPIGAWGSRRARQLCKRLAVVAGQPVNREQLTDVLWPDEPAGTPLSARLSVVLSHLRRVLGGGIIADRTAVRLDVDAVQLDLAALYDAHHRGDDRAVVELHAGDLLPEDPYDEWITAPRTRLRDVVVGARRRLSVAAVNDGRLDDATAELVAMLEVDPYDEAAHEMLLRTLARAGHHGEARLAEQRFHAAMAEIGVPARTLAQLT